MVMVGSSRRRSQRRRESAAATAASSLLRPARHIMSFPPEAAEVLVEKPRGHSDAAVRDSECAIRAKNTSTAGWIETLEAREGGNAQWKTMLWGNRPQWPVAVQQARRPADAAGSVDAP